MENETEKKTRKPRTKKTDIKDINPGDEITFTKTEEVIPTDDRITQELVKHNITEAVLVKMEKDFLSLTIADINDKDGYKAVHEARIACKNTRVLAVKLCKDGRAAAIKEQKDWIQTEDRIETRIKAVEDVLAARQKVIDDIKEAEKLERETKEQVRLNERAVKLIQLGMNFTGDAYILDDIKISVVQIKQLDEFVFGTLLAAVETKFKEQQEIKVREDELRLQAEAANKKILEEALAREEANKLKEQEIARREQAIADAEAKAKKDAEDLIIAQEKAAKEQAEAQIAQIEKEAADRLKARKSALFQLGFSQQGETFSFNGNFMSISENILKNQLDDEWNLQLESVTHKVQKRKEELEQERIAREEKIKADAIAAEKKRAEEEAYADAIAKKEKAEAELQETLRITMAAPDLEKFNKYCSVLSSVPVPQFNTPSYQAFAEIIKADVLSILKTLHSKKPL